MYGVAGTKATGFSVEDSGQGKRRRTVFRFTDFVLPMVDQAGVVAFGSKKVYTFPEGINVLQTIGFNLSLKTTSAGIVDTFNGDVSLGTVAAAGDATLTATEADVAASTSTVQAVAGLGSAAFASGTLIVQDGSAGAKDLFLNLLVDDANQDLTTTPGGLKLNGTVEINWVIGPDK